ncbi:hypothetical protein DL770_005250 [Monosporascus sp. CRB-9-2]|nr:hypothetical protein DL770_005250 [Monosporascus sp. CRB-9-2]
MSMLFGIVSKSAASDHEGNQRNETTKGSAVSAVRYAPDLEGKGYSPEKPFFHADRGGGALPPRILATVTETQADSRADTRCFVDGRRLVRRLRAQELPLFSGLATSGGYPSFGADDGCSSSPSCHAPIVNSGEAASTTASGSPLAALQERLEDLRVAISGCAVVVAFGESQDYFVDNYYLYWRMVYGSSRETLWILAHPDAGDAVCK